jgi:MFS transporter, YNFM family, putative membrane transport protein
MPSTASLKVATASSHPSVQVQQPEPEERQFLVKGTPAYKRASLAFFMSGFSTFALLYCVQPLMPIFAEEFSVSPAASSLSLSLSTGFLAVAIFCAAAVSERFGRKSLMFVSLLGASLCTIACAIVPGWNALLAIRALEGLLLGGVPAVAMAYLSEEIDPKGLGASMGLYIAGNAFGGMSGRVIVGMLTEYISWRGAMAGMGLMGIAAAIAFLLLLPPSRNFAPRRSTVRYHVSAWSGHVRHPALALLFAVSFLLMGSFVTIYNYIGFRLLNEPYHLNQTQLGLIFTVYLVGVAASWIAGQAGDRLGHFLVMPAGVLMALIGVLATIAAPLPVIILGIVLITAGFFIAHSVASALVGRLARGTKGHASSLYLLGYYLGSSVAGSLGGHFWSADGWWAVAAFTGGMLLVALLAALGSRSLARI